MLASVSKGVGGSSIFSISVASPTARAPSPRFALSRRLYHCGNMGER